jgi:YVTN family beta-propeller protein
VSVIDPVTLTVISRIKVGPYPQHVTPSWDLSKLYVNDGALTEIDARTGTVTRSIAVPSPYNLYFTVDGSKAIVVAENLHRLDFYDLASWKLLRSLPIPWSGIDHLDMSADGSYLLATCEFSGRVVKIGTEAMTITSDLDVGGLPIDVKLSPDGAVFYVTNQGRGGVSIIDPVAMREVGFLQTGRGAHGLALSRDTRSLYVSNRLAGTISVIDLAERRVAATWVIGGSPDMLTVSADGTQLWTGNRYGSSVSVIDTKSGEVVKTIAVESAPHGLTYFPQPGRLSLGHNGVYR